MLTAVKHSCHSAVAEIKIRANLLLGQALAKNAADLLVVKTWGKGQLLSIVNWSSAMRH